jgi:acyl-CoA thioester hydrolase
MPRLVVAPACALREVARVRVLYADTDRMGVVYHGTYLRILEHGRVELLRAAGLVYAELEDDGYVLPVTDVAASYVAPARYDDVVSIRVGVALLTATRVHFAYRLTVEPGARRGLVRPIEILLAQTRHCCLRLDTSRPTRLPDRVHHALASHREAQRAP